MEFLKTNGIRLYQFGIDGAKVSLVFIFIFFVMLIVLYQFPSFWLLLDFHYEIFWPFDLTFTFLVNS